MSRFSAKYLGMRLVETYLTLLVIMTLMFILIRSMPGSFVNTMTGPSMTPEQIDRIREIWGLNEPLWRQYVSYMINYHFGNFGYSPQWNTTVWQLVVRRLPRTLILFGSTFFLGYLIGPFIGMYLGWWRGTRRDKSLFTLGLTVGQTPYFWVGWMMIWVFTYHFGLLPASYMRTQFLEDFPLYVEYGVNAFTVVADVLYHLALPILTSALIAWTAGMLVMRTQMTNVVDEDYVYLARAKGLSEREVMIKHAARTALIPVATGAIVGLVTILDGSVIVENVFNYPGMGQILVSAVFQRDYPVMQAMFYMLAVILLIMRLVTDVVYTYLDPRIQFGGES